MNISDYLENVALNLAFGATAWPSRPTTLYFALFTAPPSDSGGGTEVSGGAYARKAVAATSTYFTVTGNQVVNAVGQPITWAQATAAWGTVTHIGVFSAASGGNLLLWGALSASKTVESGDTVTIDPGAFSLTLEGNFGAKLANAFLAHMFNGTAFPTIGTHYVGLGTAATSSSITGEGSGNGYARASMSNNTANWPAAASGQKSNGAIISFPPATGAWGGPFTHFIITNHSTTADDTTILWYGQLDQARTPANTDTPKFQIGDLTLTMD